MGCDIHIYIEKWIGEKWVLCKWNEKDDILTVVETIDLDERWSYEVDIGRCYCLFALLANQFP